MAKALGCNPGWLAFGEESLVSLRKQMEDDEFFPLPYLDHPLVVHSQREKHHNCEKRARTIRWSRDFLSAFCDNGDPKENLFLYCMDGDCMEPQLRNGNMLIAQRAEGGDFTRDGIYILGSGGAIIVRRLQRQGDRVGILSDNKRYNDYEVSLSDIVGPDDDMNNESKFVLFGRVVFVGHAI
ncbi:hypothetical protein GSUB_16910 (plasmid) [Geoalkalibacter subterraneus]|uniref:Peptidase S24/S26A/S26B/S26C domain-containing protein n=1 Tax=Geoalkalibacter subterraneus TaxID=483547 RepID=A0A0B5FJ18_9BACT|nr:hypothetical protein GSUB_16910 [Geoalkalibacter subterraneus]